MSTGFNEARLRDVMKGDPISARQWNEVLRLLKRNVTGPDVIETATGWHIKRSFDIRPDTIQVHNASGETAPAGACIEVYDFDTSSGVYEFRKPTGDDLPNVYVLREELDDDFNGEAWERGQTAAALFASAPTAGDIVGSQSSSWEWGVSTSGTHTAVADVWVSV